MCFDRNELFFPGVPVDSSQQDPASVLEVAMNYVWQAANWDECPEEVLRNREGLLGKHQSWRINLG